MLFAPGMRHARIALGPSCGSFTLTVRSNVYGDSVYIDGEAMGSTRLDLELPPGVHTVRVEKPDFVPWEKEVELEPGESRTVRTELERLAPPAPVAGEVFQDRLRDGAPGPEMVVIPAGELWMGSPESEAGRNADERRHQVTVPQAFALGRTEVTVAEFERFVQSTGYRTDAERDAGGVDGCYAYDR